MVDPPVTPPVMPPAVDPPVDTDGDPEEGVDTEVLPPAEPEVADVGAALPRTGANAAGVGVAGLLLVGAGFGLRRAARKAD